MEAVELESKQRLFLETYWDSLSFIEITRSLGITRRAIARLAKKIGLPARSGGARYKVQSSGPGAANPADRSLNGRPILKAGACWSMINAGLSTDLGTEYPSIYAESRLKADSADKDTFNMNIPKKAASKPKADQTPTVPVLNTTATAPATATDKPDDEYTDEEVAQMNADSAARAAAQAAGNGAEGDAGEATATVAKPRKARTNFGPLVVGDVETDVALPTRKPPVRTKPRAPAVVIPLDDLKPGTSRLIQGRSGGVVRAAVKKHRDEHGGSYTVIDVAPGQVRVFCKAVTAAAAA